MSANVCLGCGEGNWTFPGHDRRVCMMAGRHQHRRGSHKHGGWSSKSGDLLSQDQILPKLKLKVNFRTTRDLTGFMYPACQGSGLKLQVWFLRAETCIGYVERRMECQAR